MALQTLGERRTGYSRLHFLPWCVFNVFRFYRNNFVKCGLIKGVWQGFRVLNNCFIRVLSKEIKST